MREQHAAADWLRLAVGALARSVVFTVVGAALWMTLPTLWGWTATTVMSDSMAPGIRAGDVIVSMPVAPAQLLPGRIALVHDPDHPGRLRLHRVIGVDGDELTTRGDANPQADSTPVARDAVLGIAVLRAPWIGAPFVWMEQGRWEFAGLAAGGLAVAGMLCGIDARLRSRRHLAPRRTAPRMAVAASGAATLLVIAAPALGLGAHAAYARSSATPSNSFAALASYPCLAPTPPDAPTFSYSFNEASGTAATDGSGNGRTGTLLTGATRGSGTCTSTSSPFVTLSGTSTGAVTTPTQVAAPSTYSLEIWFRTTSASGGRMLGFGNSQSGTSSAYDRHLYLSNAGKVVFGVYNSGVVTIVSPLSYNDGAWHQAVATMDGATGGGGTGMRLYVDGALVGTNGNNASEANTGWWRIGADNLSSWGTTTPTSPGLIGSVDDAAVYSTALTSAKVQSHYAAGRF